MTPLAMVAPMSHPVSCLSQRLVSVTRMATCALSGRGEVLVEGQRCPIVGRVSMDLITVDVSTVKDIKEGTWVETMGPGFLGYGCPKANTIGYECLTRLGDRLERVIA